MIMKQKMGTTKNDLWDARAETSKDGPMPKGDIAAGTVTAMLIHGLERNPVETAIN